MKEMEAIAKAGNSKNEMAESLNEATQKFEQLPVSLKNIPQNAFDTISNMGTPSMLKKVFGTNEIDSKCGNKCLSFAFVHGNVDIVKYLVEEKKVAIPDNLITWPEIMRRHDIENNPAMNSFCTTIRTRYAKNSKQEGYPCPFAECRRIVDQTLTQQKNSNDATN
jgi:hypothetical protein